MALVLFDRIAAAVRRVRIRDGVAFILADDRAPDTRDPGKAHARRRRTLVMLVVGQSLARAFGIVGAASLIRYRAKIDDPKDAGVMLTALGIGLASGVGLYLLAAFATLFVLGVLWVVESFEPRAMRLFTLKVTAKNRSA